MKHALIGTALLLGSAQMALAVDYGTAMQGFVDAQVMPWAQDPVLIDAIIAHNAMTQGYDDARVLELDAEWAAQIDAADKPLISAVTDSPASDFLRTQLAASSGVIFEIFVMDAQGLNVASSGLTSDYWQGDEAKFQESYGAGVGAVHFSDVEYDESSQQYQAQISFSLTDPASGELIGAITVGVNPDAVM
ncbi:hypothetical protein [Puniceibacterium sediminis]|uniref:Uncharacterized protein n=1 Tax=Puniceibacterium sediminis TaxID=1608407 RepID=A0A238XGW1_9RHOB|nr:hypothetical protein [Puniceibacterium sediminis]SNR58147.1 hypothetical protein SAMN06265370_11177 [Puniceibacterium sediminis]